MEHWSRTRVQETSYLTFDGADALVIDAGSNTDRLNADVSAAVVLIEQLTLTDDSLGLTVAGASAGVVSFVSPTSGLSTLGGEEVSLTGQSGAGLDNVFDLRGWTAGTATVDGGTSTDDVLIGPDVNTLWNVASSDSGTLNGSSITWSDVENLTGGAGNDEFVLVTGVTVDGTIDGGAAGLDTIDFSNLNVAQDIVLESVSLGFSGTATSVTGGFRNINGVTGTFLTDSLTNTIVDVAAAPVAGTFTLNSDAGTFDTNTSTSVVTIPVDFVDEDPNPDTIFRTDGGSWIAEGFIVGDQITVSGSANNNAVFTIASLTADTLTLIATNALTDEVGAIIDVTAIRSAFAYSDFEVFIAGSVGDVFNVNADQNVVTLNGGAGNDTFNLGSNVLVDGPINAGDGDDAVVLNDGARVGAGQNIDFGAGNDTLSFAGGGGVLSTGAYTTAREIQLTTLNAADGGYDGTEALLGFTFTSVNELDGSDALNDTLAGANGLDANWTINGVEPPPPPTFSFVFALDASGSAIATPFGGTPVGDVNGDGIFNSVFDAELAALIAFRDQLEANGEVASLSIVSYHTTSTIQDMDPSTPLLDLSTTVTADTDMNGVADFEDVLLSITTAPGTVYEPPLQDAITIFNNVPADNQTLVFLSNDAANDLLPTPAYADEVATLNANGVSLNALGVGAGSDLASLVVIDPAAIQILTSDELSAALTGSSGGSPATPLPSIYRDSAATQILSWTDFENLQGGDQSDVFQFGNFIPDGVPQVTITGGDGIDQVIGNDQTTVYDISLLNGGTVTLVDPNGGDATESQFREIENLTGGVSSDTFTFTNTGSLTGAIDGAGGLDTLFGDNDGNVFNVTPLTSSPAASNQGTLGEADSALATGVPVGFADVVLGDTITRTDGGNWLTDGFSAGQTIAVSGSTGNDGIFTIGSGAGRDD